MKMHIENTEELEKVNGGSLVSDDPKKPEGETTPADGPALGWRWPF